MNTLNEFDNFICSLSEKINKKEPLPIYIMKEDWNVSYYRINFNNKKEKDLIFIYGFRNSDTINFLNIIFNDDILIKYFQENYSSFIIFNFNINKKIKIDNNLINSLSQSMHDLINNCIKINDVYDVLINANCLDIVENFDNENLYIVNTINSTKFDIKNKNINIVIIENENSLNNYFFEL
jgi:hypothetical protein